MKRKMFFRLAVVCMAAVSVLIACTKDYGSDITALQNQYDDLNTRLGKVEDAIKNGAVITEVLKSDNGVTVKLSDGNSFTLTNGEDGEDGKDGTVITMGDNGNWFVDGKDSGKPWKGEKGDSVTGPQGPDGKSAYQVAKDNGFTGTEAEWLASLKGDQGDKGDKGDAGDYYYPCTKEGENYGHWIKVDGVTKKETPLADKWLPEGTITAVFDKESNVVTFHNVKNAEDGIVEIYNGTGLNSLAVIPEMWDATLGMPMAQVYAITPSAWETLRLMQGRLAGGPREWHWPDEAKSVLTPAGWEAYFWCALYNSYLGSTGQQSSSDYNKGWDINSADFGYNWRLAANGIEYEGTYAVLKAAVAEAIADFGMRLDLVSAQGAWLTRQPPVSDLNIKYRVNPAGADLSGYQYRLIDRTLTVNTDTKAEGDNYNHSASEVKVEKVASDQINATAYINYFKYWANKPTEWLLRLFATKAALVWNYWDAFSGLTDIPNRPGAEESAQMMSYYIDNNANGYKGVDMAASAAMAAWQEMNGLSYENIVALEASKNGKGANAVVSDYTAVKLDFVYPVWTAYRRTMSEMHTPASSWPIAPNWGMYFASNQAPLQPANVNDYLQVGSTYDVASHMRFADPYYGRLEDLGFEVKYDYYVFQAANSEPAHDYGGAWEDADGKPSGETELNFGGWNKVDVTADGKVSVKEDAEDAIGKVVIIVADASIKNKATGNYYTAATQAASGLDWDTRQIMYDEFIGHYVLLITPDTNKTLNVTYDLGNIDYLALRKAFTTPAPLKSKDPRTAQPDRAHVWDDALDMDMEGFNNIYGVANPENPDDPDAGYPKLTSTAPAGFAAEFARNADAMFTVTLTNQVPLGEGSVQYTFTPKNSSYSTVCYTIKWNVVIDWTKTEPVLNPDYILYDDAARTQLTKTIINPDPVTKYPAARPAGTFPYVDSIVTVKGKDVAGTWKPQTSIKEHIKDYGQYLDAQPNVSNLTMSINWDNTKFADGSQVPTTSAEIFKSSESTPTYKYQEMLMKEAFKAYEQYRDYVVDIKVKLANGTEKVVKAYIVRYINPFKLKVTDVVLHTHKQDWCAKQANIQILDVDDESIVIYDFVTNTVNAQYQTIYPGVLEALAQPENRPTWKLLSPIDPSFGTILDNQYETENLRVDTTSAWFYWRNLGTDLQVDKDTKYEVTLTIPGVAALADKGNVKVLSVANSNVFHSQCEPDGTEPRTPGDRVRPTWEVIFE